MIIGLFFGWDCRFFENKVLEFLFFFVGCLGKNVYVSSWVRVLIIIFWDFFYLYWLLDFLIIYNSIFFFLKLGMFVFNVMRRNKI